VWEGRMLFNHSFNLCEHTINICNLNIIVIFSSQVFPDYHLVCVYSYFECP
jgi:hypothetical protein